MRTFMINQQWYATPVITPSPLSFPDSAVEP